MRQQLNRIISDKKSIGMIIFMLVIPILDIVQIYYQDIIKINGEEKWGNPIRYMSHFYHAIHKDTYFK